MTLVLEPTTCTRSSASCRVQMLSRACTRIWPLGTAPVSGPSMCVFVRPYVLYATHSLLDNPRCRGREGCRRPPPLHQAVVGTWSQVPIATSRVQDSLNLCCTPPHHILDVLRALAWYTYEWRGAILIVQILDVIQLNMRLCLNDDVQAILFDTGDCESGRKGINGVRSTFLRLSSRSLSTGRETWLRISSEAAT